MPRSSSAGSTTQEPLTNFNFTVDLGGTPAGFNEVIIQDAAVEVITYREGNATTNAVRKFPGRVTYGNVILKRGLSRSQDLFDWWSLSEKGIPERRAVTIHILDAEKSPVKTWKIKNAWPVRISGVHLNAQGNDIAIEELELTHEGFLIE